MADSYYWTFSNFKNDLNPLSMRIPQEMSTAEIIHAVRLRPGMYIDGVSLKGYTRMLKSATGAIMRATNADDILLEIYNFKNIKLRLNNKKGILEKNWKSCRAGISSYTPLVLLEPPFAIIIMIALSECFKIGYRGTNNEYLGEEYFEKGTQLKEERKEKIHCAYIEIDLQLDCDIFRELTNDDFSWKINYLIDQFKEFAYLNKEKKFDIRYPVNGNDCRNIFQFPNGLRDMFEFKLLDTSTLELWQIDFDLVIDDVHFEAAAALNLNSGTLSFLFIPFLKSYVNNRRSFGHGTHVESLTLGLARGLNYYLQNNSPEEVNSISENEIRNNLLAAIHIKINDPFFRFPDFELLSNEIIEPISNYVAERFLELVGQEKHIGLKIIKKFSGET